MRALYLGEIPTDIEHQKDDDPHLLGIMGRVIYKWQAFENILHHSTYDIIFLPQGGAKIHHDFRDSALFLENKDRIRFLNEYDISKLSQFNAEAMHCFGPDLSQASRIRRLASLHSLPITGVIHALNYPSQLLSAFLYFTNQQSSFDAVLCSSIAGRQALLKYIELIEWRLSAVGLSDLHCALKTPVIPLGIDTERFARLSKEEARQTTPMPPGPVILYFGRLSNTSKADLIPLLIAFSRLATEQEGPTLVIAGDDTQGRMSGALREAAVRLGCDSRVRIFPNPTTLVKDSLFSIADVFVAMSDNLQETFGITVAEAMAAGLPVVAADWSGYRDLIDDQETGILIRTTLPHLPSHFDLVFAGQGAMHQASVISAATTIDVDELHKALLQLTADESMRRRIGMNARRAARSRYDWKVIIRSYEQLWAELKSEAEATVKRSPIPILDLDTYDYREVFSTYASDMLSESSFVDLTPPGIACSRNSTEEQLLLCGMEPFLPVTMLHTILQLISKSRPVSYHDLLERCADAGHNEYAMILMMALGRLMKYGLIRCYQPKA